MILVLVFKVNKKRPHGEHENTIYIVWYSICTILDSNRKKTSGEFVKSQFYEFGSKSFNTVTILYNKNRYNSSPCDETHYVCYKYFSYSLYIIRRLLYSVGCQHFCGSILLGLPGSFGYYFSRVGIDGLQSCTYSGWHMTGKHRRGEDENGSICKYAFIFLSN